MRRALALLASAFILAAVAGCGSSTTTDPYQLTRKAMDAHWDRVQVEVGFAAKSGTATITLDKSAIRFVVDSTAGKGSFHLSLPAATLNIPAATLALLGVTGDSIDMDVVFDGDALYAKSPVLGAVLTALYAQSGGLPAGDLKSWIRLGTKSDFATLFQAAAASSAIPSMPAAASLDAKSLKQDLEGNGVVLTFVAAEKRNGVDANHVKAALDLNKLTESKVFDSLSRTQLDQLKAASKVATFSADLWFDKSNDRLVELDVHFAVTGLTAATGDVTITLSEPAAGTSFDAPATFVDIPVKDLVSTILQTIGNQFGG
jgi:hypothetical protein